MEHLIYKEDPTIRSVLHQKFVRYLEKNRMKTIGKHVGSLTLSTGAATFVTSPYMVIELLEPILSPRTPLFAIVFIGVHYRATILRKIARARNMEILQKEKSPLFHGVPLDNMATFIITNGGFKREQAVKELGITRKKQFAMSQELEEAGILVRGDCNQRELKPGVTRQEIIEALTSPELNIVRPEKTKINQIEFIRRTIQN